MTSAAGGDRQGVPHPIHLPQPRGPGRLGASPRRKRPWRAGIREAIAALLQASNPVPRRVLELGAGPGLLAEAILRVCTLDNYTLLDFSPPMLELSRARLAAHRSAAFVCSDFKLP